MRRTRPRAILTGLPLLPRSMVIGTISAGLVGCVVGLLVGLRTFVPTAPAAAVEVGLPATIAGAVAGLAVGSIVLAVRRIADWHGSPRHP